MIIKSRLLTSFMCFIFACFYVSHDAYCQNPTQQALETIPSQENMPIATPQSLSSGNPSSPSAALKKTKISSTKIPPKTTQALIQTNNGSTPNENPTASNKDGLIQPFIDIIQDFVADPLLWTLVFVLTFVIVIVVLRFLGIIDSIPWISSRTKKNKPYGNFKTGYPKKKLPPQEKTNTWNCTGSA